jgi:hypothetical protein
MLTRTGYTNGSCSGCSGSAHQSAQEKSLSKQQLLEQTKLAGDPPSPAAGLLGGGKKEGKEEMAGGNGKDTRELKASDTSTLRSHTLEDGAPRANVYAELLCKLIEQEVADASY